MGDSPQADASFVAAMEDVLDVYQRPHDPARPVVCLDETSKQLLKETRAPIAMRKGQPRRDELAAWVAARNKHQAKADWQFTADDARVKLKSLYPIFPFKIVESATSAGSKDLAISIG